jgi:FkbM family methyltransferase
MWEKSLTLAYHWNRTFPSVPTLVRLPFGAWWVIRSSALDGILLGGEFETSEIQFVGKYLRPGMTVLDVGAHHGMYTLLAAKKVGKTGKVISFEPSPRERKRLKEHVRINWLSNVQVEGVALGAESGTASLYQVDGREDFCNSLRKPAVGGRVTEVPVKVVSMDAFTAERGIAKIDFLKIDAEGAELGILKGAEKLLFSAGRPVLMCEAADIRTESWGYSATQIVSYLEGAGFAIFMIGGGGKLRPLQEKTGLQNDNIVAIPQEKVEKLLNEINQG